MFAISSVSSTAVYQATAAPPPAAAQKVANQKVDSDGDHDNSPSSEATSGKLNVLA
jgi:hypothetical protein